MEVDLKRMAGLGVAALLGAQGLWLVMCLLTMMLSGHWPGGFLSALYVTASTLMVFSQAAGVVHPVGARR